jgi:Flp pilus assembly protein TadD
VAGLLFILQRGIAGGGSIAARWTIWQASLRLLWPRLWLGYGADTLDLHFPAIYPPQLVYYQGRGVIVDRAHNWLLDWSLNYGIVATLIFLALMGFILWRGWKRLLITTKAAPLELTQKPFENRWLAACIAAVCAYLVGNLFLFEVASTAVVFWLLLAVIVGATTKAASQESPPLRPILVRRGVIVLSVIVVGWLVWLGSVRPLLADVHSWHGTNALNQGNVTEALEDYETAVRYQPQETAYLVAEALTAAQLKNFEQAETAIQKAMALHPTDPVLYTQLASIYAREAIEAPEKIGLAYEAYDRAITLAPNIGLTYQQYADLALRLGDIETAIIQAQQAVDLDATDGVAFGILGWAHLQTGNLPAAESAFEQAVKWQPDSADFYLGLATTYYQQGRFEAARQAVEQSLLRDPAYFPSLTLQSQLPDN